MLEDDFYLWPENLEIFNLWQSVQTQWYFSDGRRHGLNYQGVKVCLELWRGISRKERPEVFRILQAMECASLDEWFD